MIRLIYTTLRTAADHAGLPVASATIAWRWPFDVIAIPGAVLFMSFLGAAIWVFMERPGGSRLRVYGLAICYAVVSAAIAVVIVHAFGWDKALSAPMALLIASGGKRLYLAFREGAAERMRNLKGDP